MGANKALLDWHGAPLVVRHVEALARVGRVVVVVGHDADRVRAALPAGVAITDPDWDRTDMTARVRFGLGAHRGPALITPVDAVPCPLALDALIGAGPPGVPLDVRGRRGHPVYLDAFAVTALFAVPPPTLRSIADRSPGVPTGSELCAEAMDRPAEYQRLRDASAWG